MEVYACIKSKAGVEILKKYFIDYLNKYFLWTKWEHPKTCW